MNPSVFFRTLTIRCAKGRVPARKPALQRLCRTRGDILRFFSACGDLRAVFPIVAELANQIERASNENSVFWRGLRKSVFKGALRVGDYAKMGGVMPGDFGELRGGNGAWGARRGEDDFGDAGKEEAGDFVDGFVAKGGVEQPYFAV